MSEALVMKFGGASMATLENIELIARIIKVKKELYQKLIVVVSAMGDETDRLIQLAKTVNPKPPQREYDMLVSVGERISMALLAMALDKNGVKAISYTGSQAGIITTSHHTEARIVDVRPWRLDKALNEDLVVIVAGFQGVSLDGEITTLGRGGSDTSAVALAAAFSADVEFFKDVDGVYDEDPKINSLAKLLKNLSYQSALDIVVHGAEILHKRCIELAQKNQIVLHVRSFIENKGGGTIIGTKDRVRSPDPVYEN